MREREREGLPWVIRQSRWISSHFFLEGSPRSRKVVLKVPRDWLEFLLSAFFTDSLRASYWSSSSHSLFSQLSIPWLCMTSFNVCPSPPPLHSFFVPRESEKSPLLRDFLPSLLPFPLLLLWGRRRRLTGRWKRRVFEEKNIPFLSPLPVILASCLLL